jgi:protein-tyrosine phosphatase
MKILMVCLGNICRSPLAQGVMEAKISKHKLDWEVDSAGTGGWHVGDLPDARSIATAKKYGIDLTNQRARKFEVDDFQQFDLIFAMDMQNQRDLLRLAKTDEQRKKVHLMLNMAHPNSNGEVPDPYYGGINGFEAVYAMLDEACAAVAAAY